MDAVAAAVVAEEDVVEEEDVVDAVAEVAVVALPEASKEEPDRIEETREERWP